MSCKCKFQVQEEINLCLHLELALSFRTASVQLLQLRKCVAPRRVFPREFGHAEFFRAQSGQELLAGPAGFAGHLRQEKARSSAEGEMNALFLRFEIQRRVGSLQRAEDRDLDRELGQFESGDGLPEKARVADDGFGGGGEALQQRFAGVEQSDAAAECVIVLAMKGNKTAAGAREERVAEIGQWPRISTEPAGDDIGGEVEDGVVQFGGEVHGGYMVQRWGDCAMEAERRNSKSEIRMTNQIRNPNDEKIVEPIGNLFRIFVIRT